MEQLVKTPEEIAVMREGGKILAQIQRELVAAVREGMTTAELDLIARKLFAGRGVEPSFLGYQGYPAAICVSVNDEVVHGIPRADRVLKSGDLVSLDLGALSKGFHTDTAVTVVVGKASREAKKLLKLTRRALEKGIDAVRPGATTGDVGWAIQSFVESSGYSVVRELVGHGVGRDLHEAPAVPNFGQPGRGVRLEVGMTLAIEPMVNAGQPEVDTLKDGWTVVTRDHSLAAHVEHTVVVTDRGCEILTRP